MSYRWTMLLMLLACGALSTTSCGCVNAAMSHADRTTRTGRPSTPRKNAPAKVDAPVKEKTANRNSPNDGDAKTVLSGPIEDADRITICLVTSANCTPCRKLEATTLAALEARGWKIANYRPGNSANIHRIDLAAHPTLAASWKIESVPTWIVFRGNNPIRTVSGLLSANEFVDLWNAAEQTRTAPAWQGKKQ